MNLKVNRGRTLARSQALQILFQAEALGVSVDSVLAGDFLISKGPLDPYAEELARGSYAHLMQIDAALRAVSENWALERMPGADRNCASPCTSCAWPPRSLPMPLSSTTRLKLPRRMAPMSPQAL